MDQPINAFADDDLTAVDGVQGGVLDSMKLYESRLKVKTTIDRMQIDFQCCGSTSYKDWWNVGWWGVRWLDTNSREVIKTTLTA